MLNILTAVLFVAGPQRSRAQSHQTAYVLNNFEGPSALKGWRFSGTPQSPIVGGTLALGPGHHGHGAVLTYRIACDRNVACDAYAAALWRPSSRLPKRRNPAISLWIRFPPDVEVCFLAKDTSGLSLRFPVVPTLEHPTAGDWEYLVIPLSAKKPVIEMGIIVQARARVAVQGAVSFDDLMLRESSESFQLDPSAEVTPSSPEPFELAHIGVNIHLLRDNHSLDLARAAGFRFVRMDMLWVNVERHGRYRFFAYDALLRSLDSRGMGVLWILDYGHPDHGGAAPRTSEDVAAFGRFAGAVAAHFKGRNVRYEIWNEPDTAEFWAPSPNADEYAALLREAVTAIRAADPAARVTSGGVSKIDVPFVTHVLDPSLAADLSAISIHPYPTAGPETIVPELAILREWLSHTFGGHLEVWDTEWGYSSASAVKDASSNGHSESGRKRQAALAVRELLTVWILGFPLGVWYDLRDDGPDPTNPGQNYGLLDSSGNEKPAMKAVRTSMGAISGRKYVGMIQETPAGIHAMRFDRSTDIMFVVWTEVPSDRRKVEYQELGLLSITNLMSEAVQSKPKPSGHGQVDLYETAGPVYFLWRAGSPGRTLGPS